MLRTSFQLNLNHLCFEQFILNAAAVYLCHVFVLSAADVEGSLAVVVEQVGDGCQVDSSRAAPPRAALPRSSAAARNTPSSVDVQRLSLTGRRQFLALSGG